MTTAKDACSGDNTLESPATKAFTITPDNNNDLAFVTRGFYVGSGGNITVIMMDDDVPILFPYLPAGVTKPWRVKRVMSTGTTATGMVGLY